MIKIEGRILIAFIKSVQILLLIYLFKTKFIIVSGSLSDGGSNCKVFSLVGIPLLDINLRKQ